MFNEGFAERTVFPVHETVFTMSRRWQNPCSLPRYPEEGCQELRELLCVLFAQENSRFSAYFVFAQSRKRYLRLDLVAKRYWLKIHRECFSVSDRGHKIFSHLRVFLLPNTNPGISDKSISVHLDSSKRNILTISEPTKFKYRKLK